MIDAMSSYNDTEAARQDRTLSPLSTMSFRSLRPYLSRKISREQGVERSTARSKPPTPTRTGEGVTRPARARSITWSGHLSTRTVKTLQQKSKRSLCKNAPPFAEAFRHAIIHAKLEVPVSSNEMRRSKSVGRRSSPDRHGRQTDTSLLGSVTKPVRSRSSSAALVEKLFILSDDGCIFQYHVDGPSNRTPESVLELGQTSIAFASDAIPGRHWVLNVVRDGSLSSLDLSTPTWPSMLEMFSRKSTGLKKQSRELLLVFKDDSLFKEWLVNVRKEIEAFGGMQYHEESERFGEPIRSTTEISTPVHHLPVSFAAETVQPSPNRLNSDTEQNFAASPQPTIASSVYTRTDLDRLRESCIIDGRSFISGDRSSFAESATDIPLPDVSIVLTAARETELIASPKGLAVRKKKHVPQPLAVRQVMIRRSASWSPSLGSPQMPRTPTLATDMVDDMAGAFRNTLHLTTPPPSPGCSGSPFAPAQPLSAPLAISTRDIFQARNRSDDTLVRSRTSRTSVCTDFDSWKGHGASQHEHDRGEGKPGDLLTAPSCPPPDSLAPQRKSSLVFRDRSASPVTPADDMLGLGIIDMSPVKTGQVEVVSPMTGYGSPPSRRLRTLTSEAPVRIPGVSLVQQSWSSPLSETPNHISEGHRQIPSLDLESIANEFDCFGTKSPTREPPPSLSISPPSALSDNVTALPRPRELARQQSVPSRLGRRIAPAAPPPTCPLPAVPFEKPRAFGVSRTALTKDSCPSPANMSRGRATTLAAPSSSPNMADSHSRNELQHTRSVSAADQSPSCDQGSFPHYSQGDHHMIEQCTGVAQEPRWMAEELAGSTGLGQQADRRTGMVDVQGFQFPAFF